MTPPVLQMDASRLSNPPAHDARQRLLSLDVLRGITVALMILVNNAGDGSVSYPQLRHSRWNGCTLTDLVFPTFLFMVGASIELSFRTRRARGVSALTIYLQVIRRALVLFALGVLLNALPFFHLTELRFYGVLQRIALCYLLAAAVYLTGGLRASLLICAASILGYWWLMTHVAMPEFGLPGSDVPLLDPTGNLASLTDRMLVSQSHLYHHDVYDPEGLLSTLPALGTTLLGVCAAAWLRSRRTPALRAVALLLAGLICMLAALAWSHTFPFNKRLWTSSFVLWTGGLAMVLLALLFWFLDGPLQLRRGLIPCLILGTNALAAYILSEVLAIVLSAVPVNAAHGKEDLQQWLFHLLPHWLGPPPLVSFVYSLLFVLACAMPMLVLYRRRIFLKL